MFKKIRIAVAKSTRPVYLAGLTASLFFAAGVQSLSTANPDLLARHVIYTCIFFACTWAACRLFANGLNRRLQIEGVEPTNASDMIYTFVIYLEVIKHVVGVSFTLGWIAGVMASWEYLGDRFFLVPLGSSLAVSLLAFLVTFGFSSFADNLRWPGNEDDA